MGNFGIGELLVILIIILIIFGPGKLPEIGESLGKAVGNFKRAMQKGDEEKSHKTEITKTNDEIIKKDNTLVG